MLHDPFHFASLPPLHVALRGSHYSNKSIWVLKCILWATQSPSFQLGHFWWKESDWKLWRKNYQKLPKNCCQPQGPEEIESHQKDEQIFRALKSYNHNALFSNAAHLHTIVRKLNFAPSAISYYNQDGNQARVVVVSHSLFTSFVWTFMHLSLH